MLWKYKKVYQEINEDIEPPVVRCMNISSITNTSSIGTISAEMYGCNDGVLTSVNITNGSTNVINKCIKRDTHIKIIWTDLGESIVPFGASNASSSIFAIQSGTGQTCTINVGTICAYE